MIKRVQNAPNTPLRIARFVVESQVKYTFQKKNPRLWGEWLRKELTSMGPAFIKMGQFLSTRADLFDKAIVSELSKLQDDITPVGMNELTHIIDRSLGKPWNDVFEYIDPKPLACASIGQVHFAVMKGTQKQVVVKIQKPDVAKQIRDDIGTLKTLNSFLIQIGSSRAFEVENVLQQYERFLSAELDYTQEMSHMMRFREILEDMPVRVPRVHAAISSAEILVMDFVPSVKITDIDTLRSKGIDTKFIAETLINVFLNMIVTYGYVHCDPHPGNIGVTNDGEAIVLYDFGNVIELPSEFREEVNNVIFSVYQKDVNDFVDLLLKLKIIELDSDIDSFDVRLFFRSFFDYLETLDIKTLQQSIKNQELFTGSMTDMSKIKVHPDFLALFRVFSLLDGTCTLLDPNFSYIDSLAPFTTELLSDFSFFDVRARRDFQKIQNFPKLIQTTEQTVARTQKQVNQLSSRTKNMEMLILGCVIISQIDHAYTIPLYTVLLIIWYSVS